MKRVTPLLTLALLSVTAALTAADSPIDRHALATRHNIEWNDLRGQIPLGNGEFCFNTDGTGLQTFGGSTLSHWAWHSAPLPPGCTSADLPPTGTVERGRITGPMRKAAERGELDGWMFRNPHPMNLGRLRLVRATGVVLDRKDIVFRLVDIVSKGGNYLLNVGPTGEGLIPQPSIDRLREVGAWMETNGEAIYGTSPWTVFRDGPHVSNQAGNVPKDNPGSSVDIRFTAKGHSLYATCLALPDKNVLIRAFARSGTAPKPIAAVRMLGAKEAITWRQTDEGLALSVPPEKPGHYAFVYRIDFNEE